MRRFLSLILCMCFFTMLSNAQTVLIKEDFESYNTGARIAKTSQENGHNYWRTWTGQIGGSADAMVTDEKAQEGNKCMKLTYGNDMLLLLGDKYSGKYELSYYCYVPEGKDGYVNLLHLFAGDNSEWQTEMYLNHKLHMNSVLVEGIENNFDFATNTWAHFDFIIDIDNDNITFKVDDKKIASWKWSVNASGLLTTNQLAAIDFYPPTSIDTSEFYIDNITYTELRAPGAPLFSVYPQSIKQTLQVGEMATRDVTLTNIGTYKGDWNAYIKYDVTAEEDSNEYELQYNLNVTDSFPLGSNGIGFNVGVPHWEVGAKYPGAMYCQNALGMQITKAQFFNRGSIADSTITFKAYAQGSNSEPGKLIAEVTVNHITDSTWVEGVFPTPILLDGSDIWITASFKQIKTQTYPVTCDIGPGSEHSAYCRVDSAEWVHLTDLNPQLDYNIAIRAICEGKRAEGSWIAINNKSPHGTLDKKKEQNISLNFYADSLEPGIYTASLVINTDDSIGQLTVPCTLTVLADSGCVPPSNFALQVNNSNIELSWEAAGENTTYNIYRNGTLLTNVTTTTFVDSALANGNYCYYLTTACTDTTESVPSTELCAFLSVGIRDYAPQVSLYPNPVHDVLHINAHAFTEVDIYNIAGQKVYHNSITENSFQINVNNLPSGIYFLRLTGKETAVKKFIKQ